MISDKGKERILAKLLTDGIIGMDELKTAGINSYMTGVGICESLVDIGDIPAFYFNEPTPSQPQKLSIPNGTISVEPISNVPSDEIVILVEPIDHIQGEYNAWFKHNPEIKESGESPRDAVGGLIYNAKLADVNIVVERINWPVFKAGVDLSTHVTNDLKKEE
jgi:hypothetical protein